MTQKVPSMMMVSMFPVVVLALAAAIWPASAFYAATNVTQTDDGVTATLVLRTGFYPEYGPDITPLTLTVTYESDTHLRVKIVDALRSRWEVPNVLQPTRVQPRKAPNYRFDYSADPFDFRIIRLSDSETIFDTAIFERLIFKDQYLEISTILPTNANIYGLGERIANFRLDTNHKIYTIFAADIGTPVDNNPNLYGAHPFFMETRSNRRSHGVLMLNSNGMDVDVRPTSLTYKMIGGIIDMFFFMGPTPEDVVKQYTSVVGRPYFPPYWVLGFHQCKWGYQTIDEVKEVVAQYKTNNIPLDTMWTDIDYMDRYRDWTFDPVRFPRANVEAFAEELERNGQHYMLIIDPAIYDLDNTYTPYVNGLNDQVYITTADGSGTPYRGFVWPGSTVFPDFSHPNTSRWWHEETAAWMAGLKLGGLWIDMNEPASFTFQKGVVQDRAAKGSTQADYNNPPYAIRNHGIYAELRRKTIEMNTLHYGGIPEYDQHNLYGHFESIATRDALDVILGKRSLLLSRSTFPGTAKYGGHWLGDNTSQWLDLFYSISGMLSFSVFGQPLSGADICGFFGDTTEELCARWTSLGAFYPFARNHNQLSERLVEAWKKHGDIAIHHAARRTSLGQMPQESYRFPNVAEAARRALSIRYRILPYYYTLFHHAHEEGSTVIRALFFEFDSEADADLVFYDRQFLIGPAILVTPVLEQGATTVAGFFSRSTRWYSFSTGQELSAGWQTLNVPVTDIAVHVRGGYVVATQDSSLTTTASRLTPYNIIFALDHSRSAVGDLFIDDGETFETYQRGYYTAIEYTAASTGTVSGTARATVLNAKYAPSASVGTIQIWGVAPSSISSVLFNGAAVAFSLTGTTLSVTGLSFPMVSGWVLEWR